MLLPTFLSLVSLACAAPIHVFNSTKGELYNGTISFNTTSVNGTSRKDVAEVCDETSDIDYVNYAMEKNYVTPDFSSKFIVTSVYTYTTVGDVSYKAYVPTVTVTSPTYNGFWSVSDWVNINLMDSIMGAMTYYPDETVNNDDFSIKEKVSTDMSETSDDVLDNYNKGDDHLFSKPNADANGWRAQYAMTAYHFEKSRGISRTFWKEKAETLITGKIAKNWDSDKGGVKRSGTYRSASATQLFFTVSAQLYIAGAGDSFLDNANKAWTWLQTSKLRNEIGLFYDGLNKDDKITTDLYTINQGPVLSGLGYMYNITNDVTYVNEGTKIIDAVIKNMTVNNVIYDQCDLESYNGAKDGKNKNYCTSDAQYYKGAFMKHLTSFLRNIPSDVADNYKDFVTANVDAASRASLDNKDHSYSNVWINNEDNSDFKALKYKNDGAANGQAFDAFVAGIQFANC